MRKIIPIIDLANNNFMNEFVTEVAALRLEKLDLTANQISSLPVELRVMDSLVELNLDHNPLVSPPSSVSHLQSL